MGESYLPPYFLFQPSLSYFGHIQIPTCSLTRSSFTFSNFCRNSTFLFWLPVLWNLFLYGVFFFLNTIKEKRTKGPIKYFAFWPSIRFFMSYSNFIINIFFTLHAIVYYFSSI